MQHSTTPECSGISTCNWLITEYESVWGCWLCLGLQERSGVCCSSLASVCAANHGVSDRQGSLIDRCFYARWQKWSVEQEGRVLSAAGGTTAWILMKSRTSHWAHGIFRQRDQLQETYLMHSVTTVSKS